MLRNWVLAERLTFSGDITLTDWSGIGSKLPVNTALYTRIFESSSAPPWEFQICLKEAVYEADYHMFSRHMFSKHMFSKHMLSRHMFSRHMLSRHVFSKHVFSKHMFSKQTPIWPCVGFDSCISAFTKLSGHCYSHSQYSEPWSWSQNFPPKHW
jgi:hypothetical protein